MPLLLPADAADADAYAAAHATSRYAVTRRLHVAVRQDVAACHMMPCHASAAILIQRERAQPSPPQAVTTHNTPPPR